MKTLYISLLLLCVMSRPAGAQDTTDRLLSELNEAIARRDVFVTEKAERIARLKQGIHRKRLQDQFAITAKVFEEYKSFIYDSAFRVALRMQSLATGLNNPTYFYKSKIDLGFVLVSAGLFNETLDTLQALQGRKMPDSLKADLFFLIGRTCYDLAEFNRDDFYSVRYKNRGNMYLDSALRFLPADSKQFLLVQGLKAVHTDDFHTSAKAYEKLLNDFPLSDAEVAVAASTLSFIYISSGRREESKQMLIRAAIADIRACTKETVALRNLAEMLFNEGEVGKAYEYIKIAMDDANFYGANHRKIQVASIFPVIEGRQLAMVESRKNLIGVYAAGITLIAVLLVAFGVVVYKQYKKLELAKKVISESNEKLTETNHQLLDSNKIKEEYVTYYFNTTAEYISRLENLKKTMEMKLLTKKMDELRFTVESINIKRERDELYHNFDKFFLTLFPDFVTVFQSLFKEADRVHLKDGQLLNTELRIFALMRMGINDAEKIARILDYSVATIYTYKARIRNKSIVPNEEFDKRIMAIPTI
jgi:tetratricopeptide (TPR) repeat protein